jgi:flagellar basal-body rod protein FlgF/flagellar basal-body rod protein FlgG
MPYGLYISAAGAHVQSQRVEVLSNNIANANTPGFKRELAVLQARHAEAIDQGEDYPGTRSVNNVGGGVFMKETLTDFSPGAMKNTGRTADMAIDGDGFFVVEREGQQFLTRAGNFEIAADGRLTGPGNTTVLGEDGRPIFIDPTSPWIVDPSGTVLQSGNATRIMLAKPKSYGDLAKAGENLFMPLAPTAPVEPTDRRVKSGWLEHSSSNPILEMTQLIEASRAYEANIRMIQNHDSTLGSLIGRLLKA